MPLVSETAPRVTHTANGTAQLVAENLPWEVQGRLVCNCGDDPVFLGLNENPTTSAYEYRIDPGQTLPIEAGKGVALRTITEGASVAMSFKGYR